LKNLFKNEFIFDDNEGIQEKVISAIECFHDFAFLFQSKENGGYKITKLGFDKLPIWAALAKTFLESYWIALKAIGQQKNKGDRRGDLLKNMNYLGKRFHKLGVVDHIGALSQLTFKNAMSFADEDILSAQRISKEDRSRTLERLSQLRQRIYELSQYRA
jgi:glycerol-3-phosphate O-acyltransferase